MLYKKRQDWRGFSDIRKKILDTPSAPAYILTVTKTSDIGLRIRAARLRAGLTQADAARQMGCYRQQWYQWEAGDSTPTYTSLGRIASVLGLSIIGLLSTEPSPDLPPRPRAVRHD